MHKRGTIATVLCIAACDTMQTIIYCLQNSLNFISNEKRFCYSYSNIICITIEQRGLDQESDPAVPSTKQPKDNSSSLSPILCAVKCYN